MRFLVEIDPLGEPQGIPAVFPRAVEPQDPKRAQEPPIHPAIPRILFRICPSDRLTARRAILLVGSFSLLLWVSILTALVNLL